MADVYPHVTQNRQPVEVDRVLMRRVWPWLNLARVFRIAVDPRKLLLGGMGLFLLAMVDRGLTQLPIAPASAEADRLGELPWASTAWGVLPPDQGYRMGDPAAVPAGMGRAFEHWSLLVAPVRSLVEPGFALTRPSLAWSEAAFHWTRLVAAILVWSLFGGALTRMAALQFATDEKIGIRAAIQFSASRLLGLLSAPLLPIVGILGLWFLGYLAGWIGLIPVVGEAIVGGFWIVGLAVAFVMLLLMIGFAAGWPLMIATVSVQGSDGFDGFSRSYDYTYSRPWQFVWYVAVSVAMGVVLLTVVTFAAGLVVALGGWAASYSWGAADVHAMHDGAPVLFRQYLNFADQPSHTLGAALVGAWLHLMALMVTGFAASYFWTAATVIYFLLRDSTDGVGMHEVWLPDRETEADQVVRLAGVAASDQPVVERPAVREEESPRDAQTEPSQGESDSEDDSKQNRDEAQG